ncbi:hypothetical protein RD110_17710 [Rhodoferax koreense]|uniref:TVP38/TMEM64 family membrane protein n=1 Tax=Rhodoferax koreensis TaxID=1842727 RepID=A0A1P8JYI8_9BURK|nr:VTT domain-containing protein [Rhodoferax koreense]APW38817.1 hypothetical protein RD110_17710 [Rhodoferax koreense]
MVEPRGSGRGRLFALGLLLLVLAGLAMAWSWSPLREWLNVDRIVDGLQALGQRYGPLAALAGFALASAIAVPLSFLTLVTFVALGPVAGFFCVMGGALIGAAASYGVGRFLGFEAMQKLAGERVNALSQRLARHGLWAVVAVRVVPVAPFAIINMIAGATHIRLRDMVLGTALGMAPGTVLIGLFSGQIVDALKNPGPLTIGLVALTVLLIGAGGWGLKRWLARGEAGR